MKTIHETYGYYRDYIQKLGEFRLDVQPTAKKLGIPSRAQQTAYREMQGIEFGGSLMDYLAWTSGMFILDRWNQIMNNLDSWPPDRETMISALDNVIGLYQAEGIPLLRSVKVIRAVDVTPFPPDYERDKRLMILDILQLLDINRLTILEDRGGTEEFTESLKRQGLKSLIKVVQKYQQLTSVIETSSTNSQSTNQPTH